MTHLEEIHEKAGRVHSLLCVFSLMQFAESIRLEGPRGEVIDDTTLRDALGVVRDLAGEVFSDLAGCLAAEDRKSLLDIALDDETLGRLRQYMEAHGLETHEEAAERLIVASLADLRSAKESA